MATTTILSPADHAHFLAYGSILLRGAASGEAVARAVALLESGPHRGEPGAPGYEHPRGPELAACIGDPVHDAIAELFGPDLPFARHRGGMDMARPWRPDAAWSEPVAHIDDYTAMVLPDAWAVAVFVFLTRATSRSGCFVHWPGTPNRYRAAMLRTPGSPAFGPDRDGEGVECLAEAGDAIICHHLLGHSGSDNVATPRTRHALLARFGPHARIAPADKPYARMSTIEKANSARWLGLLPTLPDAADDAAVRAALPAGSVMVAHVVTRLDGLWWRIIALAGEQRLRVLCAGGHGGWHEAATVPLPAGLSARSLHHRRDWRGDVLAIGCAGASGPTTLLRRSDDLRTWTPAGAIEGCVAASPQDGSHIASRLLPDGCCVLVVVGADGRAGCVAGPTWADAAAPAVSRQPLADAAGTVDAFIGCVRNERDYALVREHGDGRITVSRSADLVADHGDSALLAHDAPDPPRHLRLALRGSRFWLVTYLRGTGAATRVAWGRIDWTEDGRLVELRDPAALRAALALVGFA